MWSVPASPNLKNAALLESSCGCDGFLIDFEPPDMVCVAGKHRILINLEPPDGVAVIPREGSI